MAIYKLGFLTADQAAVAFFGGGERARSVVYERLRELWLWGYLDRVQRPVAPAVGGSRPLLHALGPAAVPVVAGMLGSGAAPVQRRRLDRLDDLFIDHDFQAAALFANVSADVKSSLIQGSSWIPERELRARAERVKDPRSGKWLPFLPDAAVILRYPDGRTEVTLVEIDMGTQTLRRFWRKVRSFELFLSEGAFQQRWHQPTFDVVVLTTSLPRLDNLWEVCRAEVPEERWYQYSLATFDVLRPAEWQRGCGLITLTDEWVGFFYNDAWSSGAKDSPAASAPDPQSAAPPPPAPAPALPPELVDIQDGAA